MDQKRSFSWKRLLLKLCFSGAVFLLIVAIAELVLHLLGYGNLEVYDPDPHLFWRLKPNQHCYTKVDHKPVYINAHGTRGPEFETSKPAKAFRILSLGDSRTFGWGLTEQETYSERLGELIRSAISTRAGSGDPAFNNRAAAGPGDPAFNDVAVARPKDALSNSSAGRVPSHGVIPDASFDRVEVINAGVNGWSYQQMLVYFRDIGLAFHPDVVLIGEANLWTQFSEHSTPEFVKKFLWRVRLKNLLRRSAIYHYAIELKLKDFYERHRTKFIPVDPQQDPFFKEQQQRDPNAVFRSAIQDICRLAVSNHVQPVLIFLPTLNELQSTNVPILDLKRKIAQSANVPLVDMTSALHGKGESLYLEGDPVHFNPEGNRIIAERIFKTAKLEGFSSANDADSTDEGR